MIDDREKDDRNLGGTKDAHLCDEISIVVAVLKVGDKELWTIRRDESNGNLFVVLLIDALNENERRRKTENKVPHASCFRRSRKGTLKHGP